MNRTFSEPKIYTGGENISQWRSLSKSAQDEALEKEWYVYYSFRDPISGYLKRQSIFHCKNGFGLPLPVSENVKYILCS